MKFNKLLLAEALNKVAPAVEKKGDETAINRLVFTGNDVAAYNEQFCIVHPLAVDFAATVPSEELTKIVGRIKAKEIDLVYSKEQLKVAGGKIKSRLKTEPVSVLGQSVDDLIARAGADDLNWYALPEDFLDAIKFCMYSASNDPTEKHLQCLYFVDNFVVGSDDFRISEYTMVGGVAYPILIPATTCMELVRLGGVTQYATDDTWAFFNTPDNVMLCARLSAEKYDDYTRFLDMGDAAALTLPAKDLLEVIDTVSIMADGEHDLEKEIRVILEPQKIILRGEKDLGWLEATISKAVAGVNEPVNFGINPTFFANVLGVTQTVNVAVDRALFTSDTGNFRHLISLGAV